MMILARSADDPGRDRQRKALPGSAVEAVSRARSHLAGRDESGSARSAHTAMGLPTNRIRPTLIRVELGS